MADENTQNSTQKRYKLKHTGQEIDSLLDKIKNLDTNDNDTVTNEELNTLNNIINGETQEGEP